MVVIKALKQGIAKKRYKNKVYTYPYYMLTIEKYIPKRIVQKYGLEYVVLFDPATGTVTAMPKKVYEQLYQQKQEQKASSSENSSET